MKRLITLLAVLFCLALAQDEGLYAPAPPADAAFVRLIHAAPAAATVAASVSDSSYGDISFSQVTPYRVVIQGDRNVSAGSLTQDIQVEAGKFYTLVVRDEVTVLEDAANDDRAKALLTLYNLSDMESIDLKTADASTDVISSVAPGAQASIAVNGISVALGVFSNGEAISLFDETQLERGAAYSVFVLGTADAPTAVFVQSETTTE